MTNRKYGIRTYVAWLTLMPLLVVVLILETFLLHDRFADLNRDLLERGQMIARQLAGSSEYGLFSDNRTFLKRISENALQQPDVTAVIVLNEASNILVTSGNISLPLTNAGKIKQPAYQQGDEITVQHPDNLPGLVNRDRTVFDNGKTMLIYQPILTTHIALDELQNEPPSRQVGAVIVEMSWQQTRKLKSRLLWFTALVSLFSLLFALFLAYLASKHLIEPIRKLSAAIHAIGAGDLESRMAASSHIIELNTLTSGINQMTADLQHERAALQHRIAQATEQLRNLAFYDTLTLLPNRRLLNDRLDHALAASQRSAQYGALMFLDLDNFKPINDKFGHAAGDLLLIEAASRITRCVREQDTVARFGGDEFVVMLNELSLDRAESVKQAHKVAEKIQAMLSETYYLTYLQEGWGELKVEHHCGASIGVVVFLGHHTSQENIINCADAAMYQAKNNGRNQIYFNEYNEATDKG